MKVISKQTNSKMCFICGMDNPIGLKVQFYNMEDKSVMCMFSYKEEHQSFPNRVHGGLISTMLDELGLRIVNKFGFDKLNDIAKLNFKNTEKIKQLKESQN